VPTCHKTCKACGGEGDLSRPRSTPRIGERLSMRTEWSISTRSEMEQSAPTRQIKGSLTPKTMEPLFTIAQPPEKKDSTSSIRSDGQTVLTRYLWLSLAMHPILHEDRKKRGGFSGAKTRHSVVASEALPRLAQKLGRWLSLRVRSVALRVCRGKRPVQQCCRARS
jgi:hypothetical protein